MKIAIQGHPTRGKEVAKILESFGGKDVANHSYIHSDLWYYLNSDNFIICSIIIPSEYKKYTLEEFEKEFPFKVGDIVLLKWLNKPYEIIALELYMDKLCYKLDNGLYYRPESLITYKEIKEERNITLTLDKAKEWYKKGGELKEIALQVFTKDELNPLPRSWEEFCKRGNPIASWRYNIPTKYEALLKLEQLRDCWRQGWKPTNDDTGYCIIHYPTEYSIMSFCFISFLSFPTREIAEEFLKCFRDLIEKAGDLIY